MTVPVTPDEPTAAPEQNMHVTFSHDNPTSMHKSLDVAVDGSSTPARLAGGAGLGAGSAAGRPRTPYMRPLVPDTQPLLGESTILQKEKAPTTMKVVAVQDGLTPSSSDSLAVSDLARALPQAVAPPRLEAGTLFGGTPLSRETGGGRITSAVLHSPLMLLLRAVDDR